jgi:crotonobetainyl-CoA:carnitine CoA-transferase CaiB-like acyl-CoA transferase
MKPIFADLNVLDLSSVLAGPSVATFFAELGAMVTKIESPHHGGDITRSWRLPGESAVSGVSAYFSSVNFGKHYLQIDLSDESNRHRIEQLIATSDIVLVNFKQGDDLKFRLTADDVHAIQPRAVYAALTGFASDVHRIAYDVVLQAESGHMYMNGTPESAPVKMPVAMIDVIAAHQLKEGILCALYQREKSGHGSTVRCTLEEAALTALVNQASNFLMTGHVPQPMGSLHPNIAPYGETMACADGRHLVLAVGSNAQFAVLCGIIEKPQLASDERFATNLQRVIHRQALIEELLPAFKHRSCDAWMTQLIEANVPAGAVKDMAQVMEGTTARQMIREEVIDGQLTKRMSSIGFKLES